MPKKEKDFHPAIKKMQARDLRRDRWGGPKYTSPIGRRALILANAMMLAVEKVGARPDANVDYDEFKFDLGLKWGASLKVHIDGAKVSIGPADQRSNHGIGHKTFQDTEKAPLESRLAEIILHYAVNGERAWREWRDHNAEHERKEALRKAELHERQVRQAEEDAAREAEEQRQALIVRATDEAHRWRDAELLRQYAAAYLASGRESAADADHYGWLLTVADEIDPLLAQEPGDVSP